MMPFIILESIGFGLLSAYFAYRQGRNPYVWFFAGLLFGLFGVFAIFFALGPKRKEAPAPRKPTFKIDGPIDKFWYYLDASHQQTGPISHTALTKAWKEGILSPSTFVWHEELSNWKQIKDLLKEIYE